MDKDFLHQMKKQIEDDCAKTESTTYISHIYNKNIFIGIFDKCANCQHLGVWVGFGIDKEDMHLCNKLGTPVYANSDACDDYEKVNVK